MLIYFSVAGHMRTYFKEDIYEVTLPEKSPLAVLYDKINELMGESLSESIWDKGKRRFRGSVIMVTVDGKTIKEESFVLQNGNRVIFAGFMIGG